MTRVAGRIIMGIAGIHFFFGLWFGRGQIAAIARDGFVNSVDGHPGRPLAFWFLAFSAPAFLAGLLIAGIGARGEAAPRALGWSVFVFALVMNLLMPLSGGWLLFGPAVLLLLDARRKNPRWRRGAFSISTDRGRLDRGMIHEFLRGSYWAKGIPREVVDRSIEHAIDFGLYDGKRQVGFARVITDRATFAYLSDVFILESHRGQALGTWLTESILAHRELQGLRRWMLATHDAHGLYRKAGFTPLAHPDHFMELVAPGIYDREEMPAQTTSA
jgi:GNAT superfamily N-acetyltransferase